MTNSEKGCTQNCDNYTVITIAMIVLAFIIFGVGKDFGLRKEREAFIKAGFGYYQTDPRTGLNKFIYEPTPKQVEDENNAK